MANRKKRISNSQKRAGLASSNNLQSQVSNYRKRLGASGINPDAITDDRNFLEKALNLDKNQGFLMDALELLDRPRNALFTGVNNALQGESFGQGLKEGITGKTDTSGKQLLLDNTNLEDREGKLDLVDALGLGLEMVADPLDYIALPVGTASKARKAIDAGTDVAQAINKGVNVAQAVDKATDVAQAATPMYRGLRGAASNVMNTIAPNLVWKPANEAIMTLAGKTIKGAAGIADKGVEKALGALDDKTVRQVNKLMEQGATQEEALRKLGKSVDKLDTYRDIKSMAGKMFDSSKNVEGLLGKSRENANVAEWMTKKGEKALKGLDKDTMKIAEGITSDVAEQKKLAEKMQSAINTYVDASYDRTIKGQNIIEAFSKNRNTADFFNEESAKAVAKKLNELKIPATADGRMVTLVEGSKGRKALNGLSPKYLDGNYGSFLSIEDVKDLAKAKEMFKKYPGLQDIAENAKNMAPGVAETTDALTGLRTSNITKEGYTKHGLTQEGKEALEKKGSSQYPTNKTFKKREFPGTINEFNRQKQKTLLEKTKREAESAKRAANKIYETDELGNFVRDKSGDLKVDNNHYNKLVQQQEQKIDKLVKEQESAQELLKVRDNKKFDFSKLTNGDQRKLRTIEANKEASELASELKKVKWKDISPENSDIIDDISKSVSDYKKATTKYTEGLRNSKLSDSELKALKEEFNDSKKVITAKLNVAKNLSNKEARASVKAAKNAFKEGRNLESAITKLENKIKITDAQVDEIYKAAGDLSDSITSKINYEMGRLNKIKGSQESILKGNLKKISETAEDIRKLSEQGVIKKIEEDGVKKAIGKTMLEEPDLDLIDRLSKAENIIGSQEGKEFMETSFSSNFQDYLKGQENLIKGAANYNDAIVSGIFDNPKYVMTEAMLPLDKLGDKRVPFGYTKINGDQILKQLDYYKGILPENSEALSALNKTLKGNTLYIDTDLAKMLNVYTNGNKKSSIAPLAKFWNSMNNTFKKYSTLSAGFQTRNIIGNSTNMVLSGVPAGELPSYYKKAADIWNNSDDLLKKFVAGTLTDAEAKDFEILKQFNKAGFSEAFTKGNALDDIKAAQKGIINKASKASINANEFVDRYNRLALLAYATDHPEYVRKLGKKSAIDAVRFVLFDPNNMSDAERNVMKKIIPFYTFTKQNLMFQAGNLVKNTGKYTKLYRALTDAYDDLPEDSYFGTQKKAMQIPLPFTGKDGNQLFLKANLPVSDLDEYLSSPLQRTVSSTSPLIKTPFEMVTGKSTFTGGDLNNTVLKKTLNKMGISSKGVENSAQAAETILNNFGLSNVSTNLIKKVQAIIDRSQGEISGHELWSEIFRSVLQNTNEEKVRNSNLYNELEAYQEEIKKLKNQGIDVPTIRELTKSNNIKLNRMKRKRATSR